MKNKRYVLLFLPLIFFSSCSKNSEKISESSEEIKESQTIPSKTYAINVESEHGDVLLEKRRVAENSEVKFEVATEYNYFVEYIDIKGDTFQTSFDGELDEYSFVMPSESVTISVTYRHINRLLKTIAHRGLNKDLDELGNPVWMNCPNTEKAFKAAGKRNFYGMETDVHKTKDNRWVCTHDLDIKSNGVSKVISEFTYDELVNMPMDDQEGKKDENGNVYQDTICSLDKYLEIGKRYKKVCLIEFKESINTPYLSKEDIKEVVDLVKNISSINNVMFISFYLEDLLAVKEFEQSAKCQYLISNETSETASQGSIEDKINNAIKYKLDGSFYSGLCSNENVKKIHNANLEVNCWTVNTKEGADIYIPHGIDYLTTDSVYYEN